MKIHNTVRHIITTLDAGGAENQLLLLAEMQIKSGLNVEIVYLKGKGTLSAKFKEIGAYVIGENSNKKFTSQILSLRKLNKDFQGIIHLHLPQAELTHRFSFLKKNSVITRHYGGQFYPRSTRIFSTLLSIFAASSSKRIIAISNHVAKYLIESKEILQKNKINTIYYGFNSETFLKTRSFNLVLEKNISPKIINLACIARLSEEKNHLTLFKALKLLIDKNINVILYLAGEGDYRNKLEIEINKLGLSSNVIFLGKIDKVPDLISAVDLIILPSVYEGFGMIIMEALSSNKVILCANNSAMSEILNPVLPELLFDTFDFEDLANKIILFSCKKNVIDFDNNKEKHLEYQKKFTK